MPSDRGTHSLVAFHERTILVTEDEYFLAAEIVRGLKRAGAEVIGPFPTVGDARAALEKGRTPDAALLDINLRGELVYSLADLLRQRGIPFVFMTGYDRAALPTNHKNVPICDKPVDLSDFARKLAVVTDPSM